MLNHCRSATLTLFGLTTLLSIVPLENGRADENEARQQSSFGAAEFMGIVETILERHIAPPTRQQMVLDGVKALYSAHGQPAPMRLSNEISALGSRAAVIKFLEGLPVDFNGEVKRSVLEGLFEKVPGGPILIDAEEARVQESLQANRYVGIGISLTMTNNVPQISTVFHGGPGYPAGVKPKDLILEIDGESTVGQELGSVVQALRGEDGTSVSLLLQQPTESPRSISVIRGVTFIPTIEGVKEVSPGQWSYFPRTGSKIALLRIVQIGPSTVHELKKIESQLRSENVAGIVLDLRVGGGRLHDVILLADQLLDDGVIGQVQTLDSNLIHKAEPGSLFRGLPMAVLISSSSGPDRVFLAAALQDCKRAHIVGQVPTTQEMFVRSHIDLPDGERILLATGVLKRGDGSILRRPLPYLPYQFSNLGVAMPTIDGKQSTVNLDMRSIVVPDLTVPDQVAPDYPGIQGTDFRDLATSSAIDLLEEGNVRKQPTAAAAAE
ncbi:MAG: S41 family peptidase [Pirellulaceae bacterium]